jgi:allantoate deiminase
MDKTMKDRAARAIAECRLIATMSEEPGRITRRFLTPPTHTVHAHLRARMEALGMTVRTDAAGNLRGHWQPEGAGPKRFDQNRFILGSHIDTVPDAGAFDGVLGAALALELVEIAHQRQLALPIEVIAFSEEEGVRYGVPFLGSRAVAGVFDEKLLAYEDADGVRMEEAIRTFGLDPAKLAEAALDSNALGFLEIHIEQGPVLEAEALSVAAVTSIVGQTRGTLVFTGHANHAGTTPFPLRRDALAGAAEWIVAAESLARKTDGLVATAGKISVEPNAANVVPGLVRVSLDLRHENDGTRIEALEALLTTAQAIAARRGLTAEWSALVSEPAVPMDARLTHLLAEALEAAGYPAKTMPSGAGHDAMVVAARVPSAMLFLRSPRGVSHHPDEAVREEDVEAALHVGAKFLERIATESRR